MAYNGMIVYGQVYCAYHPCCTASKSASDAVLGWVCDYHKPAQHA